MKEWVRFLGFIALAVAALALPARAQNYCAWDHSLRLVNGRIHTMDADDHVVSEVTIQDGRFAFIGPVGNYKLSPCTKVINLHGRTAVPGLIDNHDHFVLLSDRPGYEVQLEGITTIPAALRALRNRAQDIPSGAWVVTIGDWLPRQFAEKRSPTLAELDLALPDHPVFLWPGFQPAVTNSLGKKFFESKGIAVSDAGAISVRDAGAAMNALRGIWTPQDAVQGALFAQSYVLSHGLTTVQDGGVFPLTGSPDLLDSDQTDMLASWNPWTARDPIIALYHQHKLDVRVRFQIRAEDTTMALPILKQRLDNLYPDFGNDQIKISEIGEYAVSWYTYDWKSGQGPANFEPALEMIARRGWPYMQHTLSLKEVQFAAKAYEQVNAITPIAGLHWSIAHVPQIDQPTIEAMKKINVGLALHGWKYLQGRQGIPAGTPAGPPYRTILQSGIHVGAGSDGGDISEIDPWFDIYYMVTGKDVTGELINAGEQVTREQALRMYTADNGWFFREENELGSIEPGKLGDVVVLSSDYFNPRAVPDEQITNVKSVLTVVGGRVVYDDMH
jgi:predicted amidohydrolase YtcJ